VCDKEKINNGLEGIIAYFRSSFDAMSGTYACEMFRGWAEAAEQAIALLKAQEPRVMTLEEVIAHYSLPPVFVDDFGAQEDYYEDIRPLYFEFPHDSEEPWIVHWRGHTQVARYLNEWKHTYNKKWRCWTSRPDEKRRAETPWG